MMRRGDIQATFNAHDGGALIRCAIVIVALTTLLLLALGAQS